MAECIWAMRRGDWKLVKNSPMTPWEMYDLASDPMEMRNLYQSPASQPLVTRLKAELKRLQVELEDDPRDVGDRPRTGGLRRR